MSDEIFFIDETDWVKEFEAAAAQKKKIKKTVPNKNEWKPTPRFTMLGLDADETETVIAVVGGALIIMLTAGVLTGYMIWFFNKG